MLFIIPTVIVITNSINITSTCVQLSQWFGNGVSGLSSVEGFDGEFNPQNKKYWLRISNENLSCIRVLNI